MRPRPARAPTTRPGAALLQLLLAAAFAASLLAPPPCAAKPYGSTADPVQPLPAPEGPPDKSSRAALEAPGGGGDALPPQALVQAPNLPDPNPYGHKPLSPLTGRDAGLFVLVAVALFIASGAGVGGGECAAGRASRERRRGCRHRPATWALAGKQVTRCKRQRRTPCVVRGMQHSAGKQGGCTAAAVPAVACS